ncbi:heme-binding protein [Nocardioides sp. KIGAM211]|uniref:Heme-binding protein n=1 Tax=Nocardioides luti TaxID=2761101 RepID=A0A7X0VAW0_9ACTN|nr:heme-binding protein [Nocardioides luti]MBB6628199.1 heme-binding protein [Nocardioides luti]
MTGSTGSTGSGWQVDDLDLASARALVRRAVDKAEQLGLSGGIVVVGASGALLTGSRMDDGGAGGMGRARSKAWIAATQRIPSTAHLHRLGVIAPAVAEGFSRISPEADFPGAGGMPIRVDGRVVAGIAASGSTVSPFFPPGIDRELMIADGQPANPEDLLIAYALEQEYAGQHGDDLARWHATFGEWPAEPPRGVGMATAPAASRQSDLDWCIALADAVIAAAEAAGLPVAVSVVDRRGEPIQHDQMDGAPTGGAYVAEAVAAASALFHAPSGDLAERVEGAGHLLPVAVSALSGGLPVRRDGVVVAGLGVGGPAPFRCHDLAVAALAAFTERG